MHPDLFEIKMPAGCPSAASRHLNHCSSSTTGFAASLSSIPLTPLLPNLPIECPATVLLYQGRLLSRKSNAWARAVSGCLLALLHCVDQLKQLAAIHNFNEWLANTLVRNHINCRSVVQGETVAQTAIGFYLSR